MKCPNCHALVEKGDMFCPECGSRIEKTGKSNLTVVIISLMILTVIVAGIVFWLLSGKQDVSETDSEPLSNHISERDKSSKNTESDESWEDTESEEDEIEEEDETEESEYILSQSNSEYLDESDVQGMTAQQLNYAKNEIYARHGRRFDSPELQNYFNSKSWYIGKYDPKDFDANYSSSMLSDVEKRNAEFLRDMEYRLAPSGYPLDQ